MSYPKFFNYNEEYLFPGYINYINSLKKDEKLDYYECEFFIHHNITGFIFFEKDTHNIWDCINCLFEYYQLFSDYSFENAVLTLAEERVVLENIHLNKENIEKAVKTVQTIRENSELKSRYDTSSNYKKKKL